MEVTTEKVKTIISPMKGKISSEDSVLAWAKWQLKDGIPAFYANKRLVTRERRVQVAVARVCRGIYEGWKRVMEELDRQELILKENTDATSMENLVKLRMFRDTIETGPIIKKDVRA